MSVAYNTTKLLRDIKRSAHIPTNQNTFTDAQLLELADSELQTLILPQLLKVQENYFLRYLDYSIDANGNGMFLLPDRAIGMKIADAQLIVGNNIDHLRFMDLSQQNSTIGSPLGDYAILMKGNSFQVLPNPTQGFIRVYYYLRPSQLVLPSAASQITAFGPNPEDIQVSSVPVGYQAGTLVDTVQNVSGFSTLEIDLEVAAINPGIITLTTQVSSDLSIGDYVALSGQSPIPQLPVEIQQLLVQACVVKIYEIQGYLDKLKAAAEKLSKMQSDLMALLTPRVVEAPKTISPPDEGVLSRKWWGYTQYRS